MVSQMLIRRMRDEDVPAVMKIESVSFGRHHWSDESFFNEMNNQVGRYYSLVNEADNKQLLGYCGVWQILDEVHVTTVAIDPAMRGMALGEVLLVHIIERAMGQSIKWITLEVRATNYSAQNLYYKYGFRSVGVRPRYYQDNQEDALIMTTSEISSQEYRDLYRTNKEKLIARVGDLPKGLGS